MRILHMIDSFSPDLGGPPEAVRQLIKAAWMDGAEVETVCLDAPQAEFLRDIPCPVHALDQTYLGSYAYSPRLLQWLRANADRFDGMVMNGVWTYPGWALRKAALEAGKPYGVFTHGALDPWFKRQYPLKHVKKQLYWPVQYAVMRDAQAVFFTTQAERDLAKTSFTPNAWNSVVVPYGIAEPDESRDPSEQIEAFYRALPRLKGRRFLLFLGRLHEKKGCDLLIEAYARTVAEAGDVDLVMAGPDQSGLEAKLQAQAAELGVAGRVHWPGLIGGDVKWGALRACDAFVLSSHQENLGVAVVEALAVGRPVLVSYPVNIWPEIEHDGVGFADEDTVEGTERLLRRWFALPAAEREGMAVRAKPCFAAKFSMKRTAEAIAEVFGAVRASALV